MQKLRKNEFRKGSKKGAHLKVTVGDSQDNLCWDTHVVGSLTLSMRIQKDPDPLLPKRTHFSGGPSCRSVFPASNHGLLHEVHDADAAREDLKDVKASFHDTLQVVLAGDGPSSSTAAATSRPSFALEEEEED